MKNQKSPLPEIILLESSGWRDYELLDSGNGSKLERYGPFRFVRPEVQAVWQPALSQNEWQGVDAVFQPTGEEMGGHWEYTRDPLPRWQMQYGAIKFWAQTSASRHLGVFPEQAAHWDWTAAQITSFGKPVRVLNLFGYTGLATLAAAQAGAQVTHVDASKRALTWARENQTLSGLADRPVRWIVDDAVKFVEREARRNSRYEGLILDPPKFGRGPKGEVWEFFKLMPELLKACRAVLSDQPLFIVLTAYAIQASALTVLQALQDAMQRLDGEASAGELVTRERSAGRVISHALYARWSAG